MGLLKYLLPALAATQLVFADDCGGDGKVKISSQGDADKYASCKKIKGDVEITEEAAGTITLNNIEQIAGSLTSKGAENVTNLEAPELSSIGDDFKLASLTRLSNLKMDSLTSVGAIEFTALPELSTLRFSKGVSEASDIKVINTGLANLDGIKLETVGRFIITNNRHLKKVNVDELSNCTGLINFSGNMEGLEIDFPNLVSGSNMTFTNVSSVSVPSLHNLTGQLGFWGNGFEDFSAPNLTTSKDLTFMGNDELKNISMPVLQKVSGGFQIARNDKLSNISFPDLETITGALDFSGSFDSVKLPSLKRVSGGFNLQSTGDIECSQFKNMRKDVIRGSFKCKSKTKDPKTKGGASGSGDSSSTSTGSGSSSSSSGAAVVDNVANMPGMGLAALFGALVQYAL